jgi:hypothetical protein
MNVRSCETARGREPIDLTEEFNMVARLRLNPSSARKYKPNYRKPPEDKQYKPGQSGNPTGRPKGVRNLKTDLLEELRTLVEVRTNGGVRRITTQKAILRALVEKARDGDVRATNSTYTSFNRNLQP